MEIKITSLEDTEKYFLEEVPIKLAEELSEIPETPEEFLRIFFDNGETSSLATISSVEQLPEGKNRSIGDIFNLLRSYYPDIKLAEVIVLLQKLHEDKLVYGLKCNDINKFVFAKYGKYGNTEMCSPDSSIIKQFMPSYNSLLKESKEWLQQKT